MVILPGANILVYVNNKLYKEVQSISYEIDYGEQEIYGIDSPFPQEIASTRASVTGTLSGLRIKYSGGIQAYNMRPLIQDILSAPYVSIRIQDRQNKEDLLFISQAKVSKQSVGIGAKKTVTLSFNFKGIIPLEPLDRS